MNYENFSDKQKLVIDKIMAIVLTNKDRIRGINLEEPRFSYYLMPSYVTLRIIIQAFGAIELLNSLEINQVIEFCYAKNFWLK